MKGIRLVVFVPYGDSVGKTLEEAKKDFAEVAKEEGAILLEEIIEMEYHPSDEPNI